MTNALYKAILGAVALKKKLLAILIDPEIFDTERASKFMRDIPSETTHIFVGGSTVPIGRTKAVVAALKNCTAKPIVIFPGDVSQIVGAADGVLFLSLLSGRNPEYLIGQQVKAVSYLRNTRLEVLSTGYILIDGGNTSAVAGVTNTQPMSQSDVQAIVDTAMAGELLGAKLIYLEAGSGAIVPVSANIIQMVATEITIPLIVGGGIRTVSQLQTAYEAGADMVVMGTVFEDR